MYQYVLFDLDGTLTDPWEGITKSVQYALASYGINEPLENLTRFIGPPLVESFMEFYGMSEDQAWEAIRLYRQRFATKGLFENSVFDGVTTLLDSLQAKEATLAIATSKPEPYARQIIEHFNLDGYFATVTGSTMQETRTGKAEVIAEALSRLGDPQPESTIMVGDRKHDAEGAQAHGLPCIGVSWGYAPQGELEQAGAIAIAESIPQLQGLLLA